MINRQPPCDHNKALDINLLQSAWGAVSDERGNPVWGMHERFLYSIVFVSDDESYTPN